MSQTGHNYKINFRSKQKDLKQTQWHSVLNWDHKLRPARDPFVFMGFQSLSVGVVYTSGSHSHTSLLLQTSWQAAVKHRAVSLAVHHTLTTYLSTNHQLIMRSYLVLDKFLYRNRDGHHVDHGKCWYLYSPWNMEVEVPPFWLWHWKIYWREVILNATA